METDLSTSWWLEEGQYADQDEYMYPRGIIKKAFDAGFELGLLHGKGLAIGSCRRDHESTTQKQSNAPDR